MYSCVNSQPTKFRFDLKGETPFDRVIPAGTRLFFETNDDSGKSDKADQELMDEVSPSETGKITLDLTELEKRIEKIEQEEGEAGLDALDAEKVPSADVAADMSDDIAASADADSLATEGVAEWEKDIEEFIDQLNTEQFESIIEFFNSMPKLRHVVDVINPKTNIKSEVVLEGLQSFLD